MAQQLRRWSTGLGAATALVVSVTAGSSLGGLQATLDNSTNSAASGTLLYTHTYSAQSCTSIPSGGVTDAIQNVSCAGSLYPASSTGIRTDAIAANGTVSSARVTQTGSVTSCGAVQLANRKNGANPMLARYGTSFSPGAGPMSGSGAITLDGAGPGGYESAAVQQAQPNPGLSLGSTYAVGIWLKTSSTAGGPLFGFGDSAANVAGTNDRVLFMTAAGKLGFRLNTGTTSSSTTSLTSASYNNAGWHFAYVTMQVTNVLGLGLTSSVLLYADGVQVAAGGGLLVGLNSYSGYWHLGWSPAANGNPQQYFAGSLSNFVVLNSGSAPANLAVAATQAAFDTNTAAATEHWRLDDAGTATTLASTLPVIATNAPCSYVDIRWGFTNPLSCAVAPQSTTNACTVGTTKLSAFVTAGAQTVSSASPGTTQTSTITLSHDAAYTGTSIANFLAGLIVYAPLTIKVAVGSTPWSTSFSWTASPGSTFLL